MLVATASPIVRQRITLACLLAAISLVTWWQDSTTRVEYPVQKVVHTPVTELDGLDFTSAEAAWSGLRIDAQGNLLIDALTETALVDALAFVSDDASDLRMKRLRLLLDKQFGAATSRQILDLLLLLKNYKVAEQRWWAANGNKSPPPHAELFQLQDELLGTTLAEQMFAEQRRLVSLMLANQQSRNDASLTQTEKDPVLMNPRKAVQAEDAPHE